MDSGQESADTPFCRPWARDLPALAKLGDRLQGLAFHSPDRLEAWALFLPATETGRAVDLLALGAEDGALGRLGLGAVVGELARQAHGSDLVLPRASPVELAPARLAELGFEPGAEFLLFTTQARPA